MPRYKGRYGFSSREVSTLYESVWRLKELNKGCGLKKFDDFVRWASETGYEKYAHLRRVSEDKPYGPDNAFWDFQDTVNLEYPKGHPCNGCDLEPVCSVPCDIRLKYWDDGMAQLKGLMDGNLKC